MFDEIRYEFNQCRNIKITNTIKYIADMPYKCDPEKLIVILRRISYSNTLIFVYCSILLGFFDDYKCV